MSRASSFVAGDTNDQFDVFLHDLRTGAVERVSVGESGAQADRASIFPSLSKGARYVAFESDATNLVSGDGNGEHDIFVRDRKTGTTERVNVDSTGAEATGGGSYFAAISGNGAVVAFGSSATNLVAGDGNGRMDVFVRDRKSGETTRVSVNSAGIEGNGDSLTYANVALGGGGRYVPFVSGASNLVAADTNGATDVFVHDRTLHRTTRMSVDSAGVQGDGPSFEPTISANGRFFAFSSIATNLVAGDGNGKADVFVHDRKTGETTRVSVDSAGGESNGHSGEPSISKDGRFVAFYSAASNLVVDDTNGVPDIFVHDRKTGTTVRVGVAPDGSQPNAAALTPAISGNGRAVAFESDATNLVPFDVNAQGDVFVRTVK
ncbi:hypothetical protein K2Z84_17395 [Candidatus Binatia bacterium]|nr:hypothetical protein [Candidatus Binatia bacterium]